MFYALLEKLCKENNVKISPLLKELDISVSAISRWKNNILPSADTLIKFAKRFNCSIDYLLGLTNNPKPPSTSIAVADLADDEQKLLDTYQNLDNEGKEIVRVEAVKELRRLKQQEPPKISEYFKEDGKTATIAAFGGGVVTIPVKEDLPTISESLKMNKKANKRKKN